MIANRVTDLIDLIAVESKRHQRLPSVSRAFDGMVFVLAVDIVQQAGGLADDDNTLDACFGMSHATTLDQRQRPGVRRDLEGMLDAVPEIVIQSFGDKTTQFHKQRVVV